jgi:protein disulfide-isomerase A1
MLHQRLAFAVLAALAGFASAEGESDVHQLTQDTFGDFVKANDLVLAECKSPCFPELPKSFEADNYPF